MNVSVRPSYWYNLIEIEFIGKQIIIIYLLLCYEKAYAWWVVNNRYCKTMHIYIVVTRGYHNYL